MNLIPKQYEPDSEVLGWNSDDAASLYWYRSAGSGDPVQPPTIMRAYKIGHSGIERGEARDVEFEHLNFIGAGLFGPGRPSVGGGQTKWTGDCYRYGIYSYTNSRFSDEVVIIRQDGGGIYAYILEDIDAGNTWRHLCQVLDQTKLWDLCSTIAHTYEKGVRDGSTRISRLFLTDRLKKRKKRGTFYLEIQPERREVMAS